MTEAERIVPKASIFSKSKDEAKTSDAKTRTETYTILNYNDIVSNIPKSASTQKRDHADCIEWRWRFFDIAGRKMIEISYTVPDGRRIYTDYTGQIIQYDLDPKWDAYVTQTLYAYAKASYK